MSAIYQFCSTRATSRRWLLALCVAASGVSADDAALLDLSLEDLANLSVTSVSRQSEPVQRAAAAVSVVTARDIERSGAQTLADAMRLLPGVHVARIDNSSWAISARGFNSALADKLEVLRDGRSLYSPLFSGVFWDQQDTLLADIERIEFIRGPGATLWGANAVNGVINIVTRSAAATVGGHAAVDLGQSQIYRAEARQGFRTNNGGLRLYASGLRYAPFVDADGVAGEDDFLTHRVGMRLDQGRLSLSSEFYEGHKQTDSGELLTQGAFILGQETMEFGARSGGQVLGYVDATRREIENGFGEDRLTAHLEYQQTGGLGSRSDYVVGTALHYSWDKVDSSESLSFDPDEERLGTYSAFAQVGVQVSDTTRLTVGSKVEHNEFSGWELQPSLRAAWSPDERTAVWGAISRAVRTPNRLDRDSRRRGAGGQAAADGASADLSGATDPATAADGTFTADDCRDAGGGELFCELVFGFLFQDQAPQNSEECENQGAPAEFCQLFLPDAQRRDLVGSDAFDSETLTAFELGWRQVLGRRVHLDLALYVNRYEDLRGVRDSGSGDAEIANVFSARTYGIEMATRWTPNPRWRLEGGYTWMRSRYMAASEDNAEEARMREGQDPEHQAHIKLQGNFAALSLFTALRYVSELEAWNIPGFTQLDSGLAWRLARSWELHLRGTNLLREQQLEFATSAVRLARERSVQAGIRWQW